jgi:hypothetical protein
MRWTGHAEQMREMRETDTSLVERFQEKNLPVKPKRRCEDKIKTGVKGMACKMSTALVWLRIVPHMNTII